MVVIWHSGSIVSSQVKISISTKLSLWKPRWTGEELPCQSSNISGKHHFFSFFLASNLISESYKTLFFKRWNINYEVLWTMTLSLALFLQITYECWLHVHAAQKQNKTKKQRKREKRKKKKNKLFEDSWCPMDSLFRQLVSHNSSGVDSRPIPC